MIVLLEPMDLREESKDKNLLSLTVNDFYVIDHEVPIMANKIIYATGFVNDEGKELYIGLKDRELPTPYCYTT